MASGRRADRTGALLSGETPCFLFLFRIDMSGRPVGVFLVLTVLELSREDARRRGDARQARREKCYLFLALGGARLTGIHMRACMQARRLSSRTVARPLWTCKRPTMSYHLALHVMRHGGLPSRGPWFHDRTRTLLPPSVPR